MTRALSEGSLTSGRPIELYEFQYGPSADNAYRATNADHPVNYDSQTYEPVPIQRGRVTSSGGLDKTALTVNLPTSHPVCELFRVYAPAYPVILTIRDGHENDGDVDFAVVWAGRVLSCNRRAGQLGLAALTCEPASTSIRRPGLRRRFQFTCPHVLYGDRCGVARADHLLSVTVAAVSGINVTLASGWNGAVPVEKFIGGLANYSDAEAMVIYRTILRVTGDVLTMGGPVEGLGVGDTLSVSRGCDHAFETCRDDFENIVNYGGQWRIPLVNPIKAI